jgi:hypothetical protein
MVGIFREALANLRGPLIARRSSAVLFLELGVREFGGKTMSFSCAILRVMKSAKRGSTYVDHCISGLHEGRIPKFDTPSREAASCERC